VTATTGSARDRDPAARWRWERLTTVPLVVLGVGFIVSYSVLVLVRELPQWLFVILVVELAATWVALFVDLVVRTVLTPRGGRVRFLIQNPIDVLSVFLPLFRPFRVVQLLRRVPYFTERTGNAVRAEILTLGIAYAAMFVYFVALATLQVERDVPGATITSFGSALWWAFVTLATVGYGDVYPISPVGRFYAIVLMGGGVAIIGTATALIVNYVGDRVRKIRELDDNKADSSAQ
jgi:voltage-gated potassium channel